MVMEESTTTCDRTPTGYFSKNGYTNHKVTQKESHRESHFHRMAKHTICDSKERSDRRATDHRSFETQRIHQVPNIQNVDHESNPHVTSERLLDSVSGFKRWIFSHSNKSPEETLPRFPLQLSKLAISCDALRPEYRAEDLYKADSSHCQSHGIERHLVPSIPGRLINHIPNSGRMLPACKISHLNPKIFRMDPERKEITPETSKSIRMARGHIRPWQPHSGGDNRQNRRAEGQDNGCNKVKNLLETHTDACSRTSQLDRPISSSYSSIAVKNKDTTKSIQKSQARCANKTQQRYETQPGQMASGAQDTSCSGQPCGNNYNSNGCLTGRLGFSDQRKTIQRKIRQNIEILNQHTRINNNLVCSVDGERKRGSDSGSMRQFHSGVSSQTLYVADIPPNNDLRTHLEKSSNIRMDSNNISHPREVQRASRSVVKKRHPINRMGPIKKRLREICPQDEQEDRNRLVCNKPEQQVDNIHITLPRQESNSSGCHDSQVGQVETLVSVSTFDYDFEGFSQVGSNEFQNCNSSNTGDTNQTLVHGITTEEYTIENYESILTTSSNRQTGESIQTYATTRLELIKEAYGKQYPDCPEALNLMAAPLRVKSIKDYEHKWKTFMNYLSRKNIPFNEITIGKVLQFLYFLFHEKHLKPGTIAHYRTALTVPLKTYFNIDLKVPAVADLIRAMWLQRPNIPVSAPAWSLNKVLEFLDDLPTRIDEVMLFRKTAFLLLLATGWRVSELHACVRDEKFCRITGNSTLHIRPHPSFLAKNESAQRRWTHKEIRQLQLEDGSISNLCPVTTLQKYLQRTRNSLSGNLLLNPHDHQKKLTVHQLSTHICSMIVQADPVTGENVHDIRSYATSCALAETMLVGDLVSAMNWSSPSIFFKFYLTQTEPLTRQVSLPVQRS